MQHDAASESGAGHRERPSRRLLISPFVGRIYDWHKKAAGRELTIAEDPGVRSARDIYKFYKVNGIETIVTGASFRNTDQIEALAGCDRLTIAPPLLKALSKDEAKLQRALEPGGLSPSLREPADSICHWFIAEDAVDIKQPELSEITFRWIMNEDPMATEKLSGGIRVFAQDLEALRETMQRRLQ